MEQFGGYIFERLYTRGNSDRIGTVRKLFPGEPQGALSILWRTCYIHGNCITSHEHDFGAIVFLPVLHHTYVCWSRWAPVPTTEVQIGRNTPPFCRREHYEGLESWCLGPSCRRAAHRWGLVRPLTAGEKDVYDVTYYYIEGHKLFKLQRYEEALAACEAAIHLTPDNVWSYYNKSLALRYLGRHEEAVQALQQAASLSSDAQFLLTAYSQQGKTLL